MFVMNVVILEFITRSRNTGDSINRKHDFGMQVVIHIV